MTDQERWGSIGDVLDQAHDVEVHQTAHVPVRFKVVVRLTQGIENVTLSGAGSTVLGALEAALLRGAH